jgi:hypothetical protein
MIDSLNDTHIDTFELRQPYALGYQSTLSDYYGYNIEAQGGHRGAIQLAAKGGTPPYRYLWNNGDSVVNRIGLTAGTYTFTITDANQCSTDGSITLTEPNPIQISFSGVENPKCFKSKDGKATINITGGLGDFSVVWNNGNFSLSPEDLSSGFNAVRIYERGNAVLDTGITLTSPDEIELQFNFSDYNGYNVSCVDCFNGSITTAISGGTAPYTYLWDDASNSTTASLSNLNGGEYNLIIIDANNCKSTNNAQLTMPTPKDWSRTGNANIDTTEFIGSTDTSALLFKTNNQEALRMMGNGNIGVGTSSPTEKLEVNGTIKAQGLKLNNLNFRYEAASGLNPEKITWGAEDNAPWGTAGTPVLPYNCLDQVLVNRFNLFQGAAVFKAPASTPGCNNNEPNFFVGLLGCDGVIETVEDGSSYTGGQTSNFNKLLLNTFCGRDVVVGRTDGGNLIVNHNLGIGVSAPNEKLEVNGNGLINGKLGIGTNTPKGILDIKTGNDYNIIFGSASGSSMNWGSSYIGFNASRNNNQWTIKSDGAHNGGSMIYSNAVGDLMFCNFGNTGNADQILSDQTVVSSKIKMKLTADGRFGIGTDPALAMFYDYKLIVNGKIRCRKLRVDMDTWADMVFEPTYELMPLNELSKYISTNKHLPDVPKESELKENGIDISEMQKIQMQKIEELILYVIELNKENAALKKRIELIEINK